MQLPEEALPAGRSPRPPLPSPSLLYCSLLLLFAVALKAKALKPVLQAASNLSSASNRPALLLALTLARHLLSLSLELRDLFDEESVEGAQLMVKLLGSYQADAEVQTAVAAVAEAAALKEEQNKER